MDPESGTSEQLSSTVNMTVSLQKEIRHEYSQRKAHAKTQGETGHLQAKEQGLRRNQPHRFLDFRCLASRLWENILLFKPPSQWYLVTAALN